MPGIDGIEATRLIREIGTEYAKNVPIIALTANAIVGNEEIFLNKGFQAFVSKPIEISRLDAVIREWVRDREQERFYVLPDEQEVQGDFDEYHIDISSIGKEVPGLDVKKGLKRFSGDTTAYLSVLHSYATNTPPLLDSAQETSEDISRISEYETIVHGIKGSSRSIGADKVADAAEILELAAKACEFKTIADGNAAFIESAQSLIANINTVFEEMHAQSNKPVKEKPDREILQRLREACISYEMNKVDNAIAELEAFEYESGGELVEWLRTNAEQTNFDEIVERLGNNE